MTTPIVAIVGYSDSGKTRVATALVRILTRKGYRIAAVKHCHDGHQLDLPEKDTAKLYAAGAARIVAVSPGQVTSVQRTEGEPSLEEIAASVGQGYDLVLAEGFKGSSPPKVLVAGNEPLTATSVIAFVSDSPVAGDGKPVFTFAEMERLARLLEALYLPHHPSVGRV